jgi:hypothetical protein
VHNDELTQVSDTEIRAIWSMEDCVMYLTTAYGALRACMELRRTILEITPK